MQPSEQVGFLIRSLLYTPHWGAFLLFSNSYINTNTVSFSITLSRPPGHPCSLVDSPLNRFVFCFLDLVIFFVGPSSLAHILHVKSSPSFFLLRTHKLMTQPSNRPSNQPSMQPTEQVCLLFPWHGYSHCRVLYRPIIFYYFKFVLV